MYLFSRLLLLLLLLPLCTCTINGGTGRARLWIGCSVSMLYGNLLVNAIFFLSRYVRHIWNRLMPHVRNTENDVGRSHSNPFISFISFTLTACGCVTHQTNCQLRNKGTLEGSVSSGNAISSSRPGTTRYHPPETCSHRQDSGNKIKKRVFQIHPSNPPCQHLVDGCSHFIMT